MIVQYMSAFNAHNPLGKTSQKRVHDVNMFASSMKQITLPRAC